MADNEYTQKQERKQFTVPSRDQLIQQIKQLDEDIEHVTLNLIKCDFNATEKDVEKTFSDISFVKVKNYNPGSFEVVFEMKIDAINFIRNHYDKKILNRRFFIKMGRQQKELVEEWTGVGFVPQSFKGPQKTHHQNQEKKPYTKNVHKKVQETQQKIQEKSTEVKNETVSETKTQAKTEVKTVIQKLEQKKEGKIIPKTEYHKKHNNQNKQKKPYNKEQTVEEKKQEKKQETQKPKVEKKEKKQEKPIIETVKEPETKQEDDGWIVVSKKPTNKKR